MIYLLHFDKPISARHSAQHYLGFSNALEQRIRQHAAGSSRARFVEVAHQRGIGFTVTRVWEGDRALERSVKQLKNGPKFCPICNAKPWQLLKPNGKPARELKADRFRPLRNGGRRHWQEAEAA